MPDLILVRGVPGSGKSTLALDMWSGDRSGGMSAVVLEADVYYALAKVWGYTVTVYRMEGKYENVHGVPADRVNIMRANMEIYEGEIYK